MHSPTCPLVFFGCKDLKLAKKIPADVKALQEDPKLLAAWAAKKQELGW